jgi:hypothetical protein
VLKFESELRQKRDVKEKEVLDLVSSHQNDSHAQAKQNISDI